MGKVDHVRQVTLIGVLIVVIAAAVVLGVVYLRSTSDENHEGAQLVRAFFNTVAAGNPENAWAAVTTAARDASSLDVFRGRVESQPAFRDIEGFELAVDEQAPGSARVSGTVTTSAGRYSVDATAEEEGASWRLASLTVDGTTILP
jgi:hypothetical protein